MPRWSWETQYLMGLRKRKRLIIRPMETGDYRNWVSECESRLPSRHRYDEGKPDTADYTEEWFSDFVNYHQELAAGDIAYSFGIHL